MLDEALVAWTAVPLPCSPVDETAPRVTSRQVTVVCCLSLALNDGLIFHCFQEASDHERDEATLQQSLHAKELGHPLALCQCAVGTDSCQGDEHEAASKPIEWSRFYKTRSYSSPTTATSSTTNR